MDELYVSRKTIYDFVKKKKKLQTNIGTRGHVCAARCNLSSSLLQCVIVYLCNVHIYNIILHLVSYFIIIGAPNMYARCRK